MPPLATLTRVYWLSSPLVERVALWLRAAPTWTRPKSVALEVTVRLVTTWPEKTTLGAVSVSPAKPSPPEALKLTVPIVPAPSGPLAVTAAPIVPPLVVPNKPTLLPLAGL